MYLACEKDVLFEELKYILKQQCIRTVYQPIVDLTSGIVLGYEALTRGPRGSALEFPNMLFEVAEKYDCIWDLELLCRTKALENSINLPKGKLLFINVNPEIIKDPRFKKGTTIEYIEKFGMNPTKIVFEITEKTAITDYKSFRKALDNYVSQGYKIAIDDTGAGYSGLKLLAESHPQYIKIDMDLVRDIDKDIMKEELIKTFCEFAKITNMKLVAEGIETINELNTLIDIGVHYGQGYFIKKPVEGFEFNERQVMDLITCRYEQNSIKTANQKHEMQIGEIARMDTPMSSKVNIMDVYEYFNEQEHIHGIVIAEEGYPMGLIMRDRLNLFIAESNGDIGFREQSIHSILEQNPLTLSYNAPIREACRKAMNRREKNIYDYIIVTMDDK
ncbi:MAG: EAL domain-containing protein, partial [Thermotaleaceae bacterium]